MRAKTPRGPTPKQLHALRSKHHLTQEQAAALVQRTLRTWQYWEAGTVPMDPALWELFKSKAERI